MKKVICILFSFLFVQFLHAQVPALGWVKRIGGINGDIGNDAKVDAQGNVYSTGSFQGTVDFDPGPGVYTLGSGNSGQCYVSKLDSNGNFIWAKVITGSSDLSGNSISIDAGGNVVVCGNFKGNADFDPGPGTFTLTANGGIELFILKLDATGNLLWAKAIGGLLDDNAANLLLDANGNVYTVGGFQNVVDFDPGPGVFNLTASSPKAMFILKLDENGNFIWAKRVGGNDYNNGISITLDANGNVYTTGSFKGTTDFDPGASTFNLSSTNDPFPTFDIFVLKLDNNGNFIWAKKMGGLGAENGYSILTDASGNIYITGNFTLTADFDPGIATFNLSSSGSYDIFVLKLTSSGNLSWARRMGGSNLDQGFSIALDANNNVYSTGEFQSTVDFDPGIGSTTLTSAGGYDIYISKLDSSGNFLSAKNVGGNSDDQGNSITVDAFGTIYLTGYFKTTADFDPSSLVATLTALGNYEIFVLKLNQLLCTNSINPTIPTTFATMNSLCTAQSSTLAIDTGMLNSATVWQWYSGSCGGTLIGSGNSITVSPTATTTYFVRGEGNCILPGNCASKTIVVEPCALSFNLKVFLQGYYSGGSAMFPVLRNQGIGLSLTNTDSITIELRSADSPYEVISSVKTILHNFGVASCVFPVVSGTYYVSVKHRNTINTWSALPIPFSLGLTNYDFTLSSTQAYGQNMKEVQPGIWALYTGDINQDENIDLLDSPILENNIQNYYRGYNAADLNGDSNVDLLDLPIFEINSANSIHSMHP